jgi:class 3 adenylate cyclase/pimeloyl-ACP methyl ester carboxylesterase
VERQIRYCTAADGASIAYSVEGDADAPALVLLPAWVSHLELDAQRRDDTGMTALFQPVRLITFDKRGTGLSSREVSDFSLEARLSDLAAVVEDVGVDQFALAGFSEGGPAAIAYTAGHPERVTSLFVYGSMANGGRIAGSQEMRDALLGVVKAEWTVGSKLLADFFVNDNSAVVANLFAPYQRLAADPAGAHSTLKAMMEVDVRLLLPQVKAPTLVMHARDDRMVPLVAGQEIAAGIRGARFISVPGAHLPAQTEQTQVYRAMVEFTIEHAKTQSANTVESSRPLGGLRTVLFTDIVGHTEMMQRLGDAKGRDVLREHERITRETLKQHGGAEVKTMGDGFMASFGSVTSAMDCAIALQRAFAAHTESMPEPLHVRVGLNAGEPIEEDGDLFGATVILASRIAAKAGPGEILVPDTIRGLLSGKGFMFGDRGEFVPKGFDEGVRLWDVPWRE